MIQGLFETHLPVSNLDDSIYFYETVLGLERCYYEPSRKAAFFWIGSPQEAMLGIWEKPAHEIRNHHIAFRCKTDELLNQTEQFLKSRNLRPYNFVNEDSSLALVFAWMPALSVYFDDPDGHQLELIAILEGRGRPELGVISYEEWLKANASNKT